MDFANSIAFWDQTGGSNWYDYCYSDQMAVGYRFTDGSKPIVMNPFAMWYSPNGNKEIAFQCDGKFNGSITNARVHFRDDTTNNALLTVGAEGGQGFIENPIVNENLITDPTYKKYVTGTVIG